MVITNSTIRSQGQMSGLALELERNECKQKPSNHAKDDAEPKLDSAVEEIKNEESQTEESEPHFDLEKASEDIDKFLSSLTSDDVSVEVPELVEKYLDLCQVPDKDSAFLESLDRVSKLTKSLRELKPEEEKSESRGSLINHIGGIQQRAMSYLEEEFRFLLEESKTAEFESESAEPEAFPGYSDDVFDSRTGK
ncbi:hypothetical protein CFP56_035297 [Quercus suber]|uniref:Uncharacterized protein n=1 Tax=Quercus suber TaxID=58331 RepID=A0AAW0JAQ6_QUESU